jgi:hypothetical protein
MSIFYEFNRMPIIENFDHTTGQYEVRTNNHIEFYAFISILEHSINELSKAGVHSIRTVMNAYNTKLMNTVVAVADKVGAVVQSTTSSYSKGPKIEWGSNSTNDNNTTTQDVPITDLSSLDDLPF